MIKRVILWDNGMVMVFNTEGQQVEEYQGTAEDALPKLLRDAPATTRWELGSWRAGTVPTTRERLESLLESVNLSDPEAVRNALNR